MNLPSSPPSRSRRPLAIAIWTVLVVGIGLVPTGLPVGIAWTVLFIVSLLSSSTLLLIDQIDSDRQPWSRWSANVSAAVSIVIPLVWSYLLTRNASSGLTPMMMLITSVPVSLALLVRPSGQERQRAFGGKLFASEKNLPSVASTSNKGGQPLSEVNSEGYSSSPNSNPLREIPIPVEFETRLPVSNESSESDDGSEIPSLRFSQRFSQAPTEVGEEVDRLMPDEMMPDTTQWLRRSQTAGGEVIQGGLRVDFAEGQRDATVHLSFCPPFPVVPNVTTEDLDGADLEIRVAACFPFGARLSIRRKDASKKVGAAPDSANSCRVGFVAVAEPLRRAA